MDLESVLRDMELQGQDKTASEQVPSVDAKLQTALVEAVQKTAATVAPEPKVAASSPVDDLMKIASTLAGTEKESELAHAALLGSMFGEAAIAKFAAYDAQVKIAMAKEANATPSEALLKEAVAYGYNLAKQEKTAGASNDELFKLAAQKGYEDTCEKIAREQYAAGHDQGLQDIHTGAMVEFIKGAAEVEMLVNLQTQAR
jgi:hypothetical protein